MAEAIDRYLLTTNCNTYIRTAFPFIHTYVRMYIPLYALMYTRLQSHYDSSTKSSLVSPNELVFTFTLRCVCMCARLQSHFNFWFLPTERKCTAAQHRNHLSLLLPCSQMRLPPIKILAYTYPFQKYDHWHCYTHTCIQALMYIPTHVYTL